MARFPELLAQAMRKKRWNQSDLARAVFGTLIDPRGYEVARNRDAIGHYLAGTRLPSPATLTKLAKALGVPLKVFQASLPAPPLHRPASGNPQATLLRPGVTRMSGSWECSTEVAEQCIALIHDDPVFMLSGP